MTQTEHQRFTPRSRHGEKRRQDMLDALEDLLERRTWRELTVVTVARQAGCTPGLFYMYWGNLEAAVRVLAQAREDAGRPLGRHLRTVVALMDAEALMDLAPA